MSNLARVIPYPTKRGKPKPRPFGCVKQRRNRLYIRFRYLGEVIEKSTGLAVTKPNEKEARAFLDRVEAGIQAGTFRFSEAFPNAPDEEKALFTKLEGREYKAGPESVTFGEYLGQQDERGEYITGWCARFEREEPSETKRDDYRRRIRAYIRPYFGEMAFAEINGVTLKGFVLGRLAGLSGSTVRNVLSVFRAIWDDAQEEHGWDLRDPIHYLKEKNNKAQIIPKKRGSSPTVFRLTEWLEVVRAMDAWYRPVAELMVLTGMIASEFAGLQRTDIGATAIHVRGTKTEFRDRLIPLTPAIRSRLEVVLSREQGEHPFRTRTGLPFDADTFRKNPWTRALRKAGVDYRNPYSTRHTFAAWSLVAGVHPEELVALMGHGSKRMVYEVYGKYVTGLRDDADEILEYFGRSPLRTKSPEAVASGERWGEHTV